MSVETTVDYQAVLADLEARIAKLQAMADGVREILAGAGIVGSGPSNGPGGGIRPDAFLKLSLPEATKKHLTTTRQKQSTQDLMAALESGGLPPVKYNTLYAILRRRENQVGDIINMKGDWALEEWYPNRRKTEEKPTKKSKRAKRSAVKHKDAEKTEQAATA